MLNINTLLKNIVKLKKKLKENIGSNNETKITAYKSIWLIVILNYKSKNPKVKKFTPTTFENLG